MRTYPECIPCMMRQALEASRFCGADEDATFRALRAAADALRWVRAELTPLENSSLVHDAVRRELGCPDPYREEKMKANMEAKNYLGRLELVVKGSEDPLRASLLISVAGNAADYGPESRMGIPEAVTMLLERGFAVDDYGSFRRDLEGAQRIAVLGDNAGEVVLDTLLLSELRDLDVTYYVKERPLINDATPAEARDAGVDKYARIGLIPFKRGIVGLRSPEFKEELSAYDVVIAKGQGNYETLSEEGMGIFFAFIAKCPVVARELGVEPWTPVFLRL